jgi:hypothetical protein
MFYILKNPFLSVCSQTFNGNGRRQGINFTSILKAAFSWKKCYFKLSLTYFLAEKLLLNCWWICLKVSELTPTALYEIFVELCRTKLHIVISYNTQDEKMLKLLRKHKAILNASVQCILKVLKWLFLPGVIVLQIFIWYKYCRPIGIILLKIYKTCCIVQEFFL